MVLFRLLVQYEEVGVIIVDIGWIYNNCIDNDGCGVSMLVVGHWKYLFLFVLFNPTSLLF